MAAGLYRGPDKYARPDLRAAARRVRRNAPESAGAYAGWADRVDDVLTIADGVAEACDRLDDAEAVIESEP